MTLWHQKQETVPVEDRRGSKNSIFPKRTFAGVVGLSAGAGATVGNGCQRAAS